MVRPRKGDEPLDQRVQLVLTTSELAALDDWRFARRIGSRSEAIRQLIARGLEADAKPDLTEIVASAPARDAPLSAQLGRGRR